MYWIFNRIRAASQWTKWGVSGSFALLAACLGNIPVDMMSTPPPSVQDPTTTAMPSLVAAGPMETFNHEIDQRDPFEILAQRQEEGPPAVSTRLHSCQKLTYAELGSLLTSRGVNLAATAAKGAAPTAGELYAAGAQALGSPNYAARTAEPTDLTTASATKLFDIYIQAAPEIIKAMPTLPACTLNGTGARVLDDGGACLLDGISCLLGAPATQQYVDLCNQLVQSASTRDIGQRMAVAAILSAAHTCE